MSESWWQSKSGLTQQRSHRWTALKLLIESKLFLVFLLCATLYIYVCICTETCICICVDICVRTETCFCADICICIEICICLLVDGSMAGGSLKNKLSSSMQGRGQVSQKHGNTKIEAKLDNKNNNNNDSFFNGKFLLFCLLFFICISTMSYFVFLNFKWCLSG